MKMFIANWKMNLTFQQELLFFKDHLEELKALKNKLIVCPSFPALAPLFAQDCSEFEPGPFTGQVSAASLVQVGCSYVLVGHPDPRAAGTTSEQVAQKALRVLEAGMIPLIFVGESWTDHTNNTTFEALEKQLEPLKKTIGNASAYLVYEPLWPQPPTALNHLAGVLFWLKQHLPKCALLYGGGVDELTITTLQDLPLVSGFVLGKASLDFHLLKKIVS
jgi:triosephosphate isomerase